MSEWQPIETAPKDGRSVLVFSDHYNMIVVFWNGKSWDDGDFFDNLQGITHWMPLPEPPDEESGGE